MEGLIDQSTVDKANSEYLECKSELYMVLFMHSDHLSHNVTTFQVYWIKKCTLRLIKSVK